MKSIIIAVSIILSANVASAGEPTTFPVVFDWHLVRDPDGECRWYYQQATPNDGQIGWVCDPKTGGRVWWRWVYVPRPHVVYYRDLGPR